MSESEQPEILFSIDKDIIGGRSCAICGRNGLRVVHTPGRPDYAICDHCSSAYVLDSGDMMRVKYGRIPETMPETRQFALKRWQTYNEVAVIALRERKAKNLFPENTERDELHMVEESRRNLPPYLQMNKRLKPLPPPVRLRETGELPDLDSLFMDE